MSARNQARRAAEAPLSRDSHVAMYRQIAGQLREAIATGAHKPGERIPPELDLIRSFGVSRITVRQAVDLLAREGLLIRKQGKGTFVAMPIVHHRLLELRGMHDELVAQGHDPKTRLIEFGQAAAPPRIAQRLGTGQRPLLHFQRLYEVRGRPFALGVAYLDAGRLRLTREQVESHPTYAILEGILGERIGRADVSISYDRTNAALAKILQLARGTPLMVFERVSFNAEGLPREHSLYYARAEAYQFSLTVGGKLPITSSLKAAR